MKIIRQKGFTIIELLLYMGLFSVITLVTLQMFGTVFDAQVESQATSGVSVDGRYILSRFSYDMNRASSIVSPAANGSSGTSFGFIADGDSITYSLSGGNLILTNTTDGVSGRLNSDGSTVSDLNFQRLSGYNGKDLIQISFTLTSTAIRRDTREVRQFQTTAGLR
jgi:type II secretory pathway pseudopilin PulG